MPRDLPIPFSPPMVRALLAGSKTETRRQIKDAPEGFHMDRVGPTGFQWTAPPGSPRIPFTPRYSVGDRLWVREAWRADKSWDAVPPRDIFPIARIHHEAGGNAWPDAGKLRPSMFMPRWASRLTLVVTEVAVERLKDITHAGALAEGVEMESADPPFYYVPGIWPHSITGVGIEDGKDHAQRSYFKLWDHINGEGAADQNPWVTVTRFRVIKENIDTVEGAA